MEIRICKLCKKEKNFPEDFYLCKGIYRKECKSCVIKKNTAYQKRFRTWKDKETDLIARRAYMKEYRAKNKEKFAKYRADRLKRYPNYNKDYYRKLKERGYVKRGKNLSSPQKYNANGG